MASLQEITSLLAQNFTFLEATNLAKPLSLFILGLAVYSWFIFKFYRFLAKREIFEFKINKGESSPQGFRAFLHGSMYLIKHIIIFPLFLLFWVLILTTILAFLSKNAGIENILLISVALVGVIRLMAYYDEDLSKDLAKMMPFALLGVFLVDISFFSVSNSLETIKQIPSLWKLIVYYLVIIVLLEFVLRIFFFIFSKFKKT
jgi:hypothetical protein